MKITISKKLTYVLATVEFFLIAFYRFARLDIELMKNGNREWVDRNKDYFIHNEIRKALLEVYEKWGLETDNLVEGLRGYVQLGGQADDARYLAEQESEGVE